MQAFMGAPAPALSQLVQGTLSRVPSNSEMVKEAEQSYQAWLGFYNSNCSAIGWSKAQLVQMANVYSRVMGLKNQPYLEKKTVGKMGLKGVPGLLTK